MTTDKPDGGPAFPATFLVHTLQGAEPCCVKHAKRLEIYMRSLFVHIKPTKAPKGSICNNCVNEARAKP